MRRFVVVVCVLAGCDRILGLSTIPTSTDATAFTPSWLAAAGGHHHTCAIRNDGSLWCWGDNSAGELGTASALLDQPRPAAVGNATWSTIATYWEHTCGIQHDRSLWCWGSNELGQLGIGSAAPSADRPQAVEPRDAWTAVATGFFHTCAIRSDGSLWCWGDNGSGQLGNGGTSGQATPQQVGTSMSWVSVAAGDAHTCAIDAASALWCWGDNSAGELGFGALTPPLTVPAQVSSGWSVITAGSDYTCGVTTTGHLQCWGDNLNGQLGTGDTTSVGMPTAVRVGGIDASDWVGVVASHGDHGHGHTCAWNGGHDVYCWGENARGQLVGTSAPSIATPSKLAGAWTAVAVGANHTCAISGDGTMSCVGADGWGQLGDGGTFRTTPVGVGSAATVSAGAETTCIQSAQKAACGGDNTRGQLGNGTTLSHASVVPVSGLWTAVVSGLDVTPLFSSGHTCAIDTAQGLRCWGYNGDGAIGDGTTTDAYMPVQDLMSVIDASASLHTCAIIMGGLVRCWGLNDVGQVSVSAPMPAKAPQAITLGAGRIATSISVGERHSCALDSLGATWCWGANASGQLGDGGTVKHGPQTTVAPAALAIFAGGDSTCVLDALDQAWCFGANAYGQLGIASFADQPTPAMIAQPSTWTTLSLGATHACGISASQLYCWGDNRLGQLGNGMQAASNAPQLVGSDSDWVTVSCGTFYTCATKTDNSVWCWGSDDSGQLLDGVGWRESLVPVVMQ